MRPVVGQKSYPCGLLTWSPLMMLLMLLLATARARMTEMTTIPCGTDEPTPAAQPGIQVLPAGHRPHDGTRLVKTGTTWSCSRTGHELLLISVIILPSPHPATQRNSGQVEWHSPPTILQTAHPTRTVHKAPHHPQFSGQCLGRPLSQARSRLSHSTHGLCVTAPMPIPVLGS